MDEFAWIHARPQNDRCSRTGRLATPFIVDTTLKAWAVEQVGRIVGANESDDAQLTPKPTSSL